MAGKDDIISGIKSFLPLVEGFSAHPYWDVSRYSWGYGTEAPGPEGTISRGDAADAMVAHVMQDYTRLMGAINMPLTTNQWVALLSFSYNLGVGDALKLVPLINAWDMPGLADKWGQYVYANHVVNADLVTRRQKEWELWNT